MAYTRKTTDEWEVLANYGYGYEVVTTETTLKGAKQQAREYRENDVMALDVKIKKRRVPRTCKEECGV
jgi:hypothetical protein